MGNPIQPLKTEPMPERVSAFWKMTGPGAVLVGLSIGAGEIVVWPRIAAEYGASMIWAAALGVFLQLWVNIEIGRWTVATGESTYTGFTRLWKGWAVAFILFNVCGWILPGWARTSGDALKALLLGPDHASPDWLWTGITFAGVALALFGPRQVYRTMEKVVTALVVLVVLGLVFIALRVGSMDTVREMARGVANVGHIAEGFSAKELFSALVFAGAGGTANLFYAFYLRDKNIGMGARITPMVNPFRGREESRSGEGYIFPADEENTRRFRDWFRFVQLDQTLYFFALNVVTIFLFIFGALAVLHPAGIVPSKGSLIWDEAGILSQTMGTPGRYLFLAIGLATLFSTQITLTDGVARSLADIIHTTWAAGRRFSTAQWYAGVVVFIITVGIGLTAWMEARNVSELGFLFNAGYIGGFAMAAYTPLLLWMNLRHLPKAARPHPVNIVFVSFAAVVYVGFAVTCLISEIQALAGKFS